MPHQTGRMHADVKRQPKQNFLRRLLCNYTNKNHTWYPFPSPSIAIQITTTPPTNQQPMDPDLDSGLFGIQLSDSEDGSNNDSEPAEGTRPKKGEANTPVDRTAQSEEEFQAVRREYRVKVENGEIWKTIQLPVGPGRVSKPDAQALLHAVEELYFFRRYSDGANFARAILSSNGDEGGPIGLDEDTKKLLRYYETKCIEKQG
ncbi:uncharacterized protein F4812DRAFT_436182 [Daldinia caldariorum]|uniref:uncharacterized protein n=1 Tax=Daldinia caldariorum TaxID=326644 RepID=UPI002007C022|nr:uncharacterized protein F4812DRAFT_436182 [Daldinia caldariorum]KAI1466178.1 hypothetical protein F4812DRAFT_436182 [Daldinia caldariorum]